MCRFLCSEPIVVSSPLSELIETDRNWLGGRNAGRRGTLRSGGQRDGFGFANHGTWIGPKRSRHSAGIGALDWSRRYQTLAPAPLTSPAGLVYHSAVYTLA